MSILFCSFVHKTSARDANGYRDAERSGRSRTGEAGGVRGAGEARRIMRAERDVEGELLVHGERRTADARVVQRTAMAGVDVQRRVGRDAQALKRVQRFRPEIQFAAAAAGEFARGEVRPARRIPRRQRRSGIDQMGHLG
jgi:hypothetical protein